tara:strand:- start:953 stop:1141 length:189 start_codon:yes stop_codon:yes gene_type:complete
LYFSVRAAGRGALVSQTAERRDYLAQIRNFLLEVLVSQTAEREVLVSQAAERAVLASQTAEY